jgi:hypothetical protein
VRRIWTLIFQGCSHINKQFSLQMNELLDCSVPSPKLLQFLTIIINCYWRINTLKTVGKIIWSPQRWFSTVCLTTNFWMGESECQTLYHQMVSSTSNMCSFRKSVNICKCRVSLYFKKCKKLSYYFITQYEIFIKLWHFLV